MDSFVDNIYPTPLYVANIANENLFNDIQQEAVNAIEAAEFVTRDDWGPTHYLSDASFLGDVIKRQNMQTFSKVLHAHLEQYMNIVGFKMQPYVMTSWFALFQPGQYGHVHNHGDNDVSGCYYVQTSGDGDIFFSDPRPGHDANHVFNGKYMSGGRSYRPEVGKLLLFPSYLNHGIKTNTSNEDRISLAFNIKFLDPRFEIKQES